MSQEFEFLSFDAPETDGLVEAVAPPEPAPFDGRPGLAVVDTDQAVTDYLSGLFDRDVDVASTLTELESQLGRWPAVVIMGPSCTEEADLAVVERWSRALLASAVRSLVDVVAVSGVYRTAPVGGPEQDDYLNLVVEISTTRGPWGVLAAAQELERAADRRREVRWGPRTLDVDVLLYEGVRLETDRLTVPHPRMWDRAFVLEPLADVAPDLLPAGWRDGVADQEIERVDDLAL